MQRLPPDNQELIRYALSATLGYSFTTKNKEDWARNKKRLVPFATESQRKTLLAQSTHKRKD